MASAAMMLTDTSLWVQGFPVNHLLNNLQWPNTWHQMQIIFSRLKSLITNYESTILQKVNVFTVLFQVQCNMNQYILGLHFQQWTVVHLCHERNLYTESKFQRAQKHTALGLTNFLTVDKKCLKTLHMMVIWLMARMHGKCLDWEPEIWHFFTVLVIIG